MINGTYHSKSESVHFSCDDSTVVFWWDVSGGPYDSCCPQLRVLILLLVVCRLFHLQRTSETEITNLGSEGEVEENIRTDRQGGRIDKSMISHLVIRYEGSG